ncbi:hypothetical protein C8Q76DRAFT_714730 [Earliella scabrosa]|nr:hypothetical protein C8Q76DRAFT_714730 [Earliella scabrosa]
MVQESHTYHIVRSKRRIIHAISLRPLSPSRAPDELFRHDMLSGSLERCDRCRHGNIDGVSGLAVHNMTAEVILHTRSILRAVGWLDQKIASTQARDEWHRTRPRGLVPPAPWQGTHGRVPIVGSVHLIIQQLADDSLLVSLQRRHESLPEVVDCQVQSQLRREGAQMNKCIECNHGMEAALSIFRRTWTPGFPRSTTASDSAASALGTVLYLTLKAYATTARAWAWARSGTSSGS